MSKWRKKPVVVEAEVYRPGLEDGIDYWCAWWEQELVGDLCKRCTVKSHCHDQFVKRPYINTLEGKHYITPGDYIITGVQGERYPCKPDIFAATYEPADSPGQPDAREAVVEAARELAELTKGLKEKLPTYLPPTLVGGPPWEGTIEWSADVEKFLELRQALESLERALARLEVEHGRDCGAVGD